MNTEQYMRVRETITEYGVDIPCMGNPREEWTEEIWENLKTAIIKAYECKDNGFVRLIFVDRTPTKQREEIGEGK